MESLCCRHWEEKSAQAERLFKSKPQVYKEECMYCFKSWEEPDWIDVCVVCMQGFCPDHFPIHKLTNPSHNCCVRASLRTINEGAQGVEQKQDTQEESGSPCKELKVEIPTHSVAYDHTFAAFCQDCQQQLTVPDDPILKYIQDSVEASKVTVSSWTEEKKQCEHILNLQQSNPQAVLNLKSCSQCELSENLWLCLSCGELGCGRKQFDGNGGNGHASAHYSATRHPCCVKLGTLKNARPDIHCYACDEMVVDEQLDMHLELYHIDRAAINPEKGMDELQYEQNINFQMTSDDGKEFERASGVAGIQNLGNSCYLASIVQPVVRLTHSLQTHDPTLCDKQPKDCKQCQFTKLKNALLSPTGDVKIRPWMFKRLIGEGHEEFSSTRQQDAAEFFAHLLKTFNLYDLFSFGLQQTLKCNDCGFVSAHVNQVDYLQTSAIPESKEPINLASLIEDFFKPEHVDMKCSKCSSENVHKKYGLVNGLKESLVVVIGRSTLKNWVPVKVDTSIKLPESMDISPFMEGIIEFVPDPSAMEQLEGMGFPVDQCKLALKQHENNVENALNALLSGEVKLEDSQSAIDEIDIVELVSMGFDQELVVKALKKTKNKEAACEILLTDPSSLFCDDDSTTTRPTTGSGKQKFTLSAFVSHKGSSLHCGHYIVHIKIGDQWLMFNDDRVVIVPNEQVDHAQAYIAFYC